MNLDDKSVLVFDSGLFPHVAERLARDFGRVLYYSDWKAGAFPTSKKRMVGTGLENVTRVYSWLSHLSSVDMLCFTDVYNGDESQFAREMGRPVWGAGRAEVLETERWRTRELMREHLGMPVVPAELVLGTSELRRYLTLMDPEDFYIKCSVTRGDFETRKHRAIKLTDAWITKMEGKLGPWKEEFEFIVEEKIAGFETGYDGYIVNGQYGPISGWGYEIKDRGYVLKLGRYEDIPEVIKQVNRAFLPAIVGLLGNGATSYHNEIRIGEDGTAYLIDPTMRFGRPPSECFIEAARNWPQVMYAGSHGRMLALEAEKPYAAEIILKSDWVREDYLAVYYPPEIARWIKIGNSSVVDGQRYVIPQDDPEFGSAVGIGDSFEEACEMARENAEQVEALDIDFQSDVFEAAQECIKQGAEYGCDF